MDKKPHSMEDLLMELLIENGPEAILAVFTAAYNMGMKVERERFIGAEHYERAEGRRAFANGYKSKRIDTSAGTATLSVPKTTASEPPRPRQCPSVLDPSWRFSSFAINLAKLIDSENRQSSHGVERKEAGMVALDRIPVDQVSEHDDRMVHVEEILQPEPQHVVCPGSGILGFMGASSFLVFKARLCHSQQSAQTSEWRFSQ